MESKHKNALIGALLAVVFVMAVGYAAFAQQLTINGTAEITSNWDVHFDTGYDDDITPVAGKIGVAPAQGEDTRPQSTTAPSGAIDTLQNLTATLSANLVQPGDTVTFNLWVKNYGSGLKAKAVSTSPSVSLTNGGTCTGLVCTNDHIKWTVSSTHNTLLPSDDNSKDVVTIIAEYTDVEQNENFSGKATTSNLTVTLNYEQVNS